MISTFYARGVSLAEVKEVVQIASQYLKDLVAQADNLRLEQVQQVDYDPSPQWSVILSFPDDDDPLGMFNKNQRPRVFKEILVDGKQNKATALKVWKY